MKKDIINEILLEKAESLENKKHCLERSIKSLSDIHDKLSNDVPLTADEKFCATYLISSEMWEIEEELSHLDDLIDAIDEFIGSCFEAD